MGFGRLSTIAAEVKREQMDNKVAAVDLGFSGYEAVEHAGVEEHSTYRSPDRLLRQKYDYRVWGYQPLLRPL